MSEFQADDLLAELRKAKVEELIVHSASLFASLGFGKLSDEARDLEQARLAIEALKALVGLLSEEQRRELQGVVASLQLAYADAVGGSADRPL